MERKNNSTDAPTSKLSSDIESPERREMIRKLVKAGSVAPVAAVIYNASTTVAAAS